MSSRRGLRSGHRRRTSNRLQPDGQDNADAGACIDLTVDIGGDEVIDLTNNNSNIMDSPVVVISAADDVGPVRRHRGSGRRGRRRSNSHRSLVSQLEEVSSSSSQGPTPSCSRAGGIELESSDEELPDIPFQIPKESSKANASFCKSPPLQIHCPICLDDLKQIKSSKKRVMSTICGHIFCEECIVNAIRTYRSCPTCRKTLAQNKIHPLFL